MPLTSAIASNSFSTGMQVLRAQMAASGGGEITVGGQTVRITYSETDGRFLASGGNNSLLSGLLLTGLNGGPEALRDIMLRMVSGSGNTQSHGDIEGKYHNVSFLLIRRAFSVHPRRFDAQLYWINQKKVCLLKIQKVLWFVPYLIRFLFLIWFATVGSTR